MESSAKVLGTCCAWEDMSILKIGSSLVMIGYFFNTWAFNANGEPFGIRSCYPDLTTTFRLISVQFATKSYKFFSVRLVKINVNSLAINLNVEQNWKPLKERSHSKLDWNQVVILISECEVYDNKVLESVSYCLIYNGNSLCDVKQTNKY